MRSDKYILHENWKTRYCVLKKTWLFVLDNENNRIAHYIINVANCVLDTFFHRRLAFVLHGFGENRSYIFEAENYEMKVKWMETLLKCIYVKFKSDHNSGPEVAFNDNFSIFRDVAGLVVSLIPIKKESVRKITGSHDSNIDKLSSDIKTNSDTGITNNTSAKKLPDNSSGSAISKQNEIPLPRRVANLQGNTTRRHSLANPKDAETLYQFAIVNASRQNQNKQISNKIETPVFSNTSSSSTSNNRLSTADPSNNPPSPSQGSPTLRSVHRVPRSSSPNGSPIIRSMNLAPQNLTPGEQFLQDFTSGGGSRGTINLDRNSSRSREESYTVPHVKVQNDHLIQNKSTIDINDSRESHHSPIMSQRSALETNNSVAPFRRGKLTSRNSFDDSKSRPSKVNLSIRRMSIGIPETQRVSTEIFTPMGLIQVDIEEFKKEYSSTFLNENGTIPDLHVQTPSSDNSIPLPISTESTPHQTLSTQSMFKSADS